MKIRWPRSPPDAGLRNYSSHKCNAAGSSPRSSGFTSIQFTGALLRFTFANSELPPRPNLVELDHFYWCERGLF